VIVLSSNVDQRLSQNLRKLGRLLQGGVVASVFNEAEFRPRSGRRNQPSICVSLVHIDPFNGNACRNTRRIAPG
jgi:hypothetical protein